MNFLTKKIFDVGDDFFVLDISDLSIKALQIEKGNKLDRVRSYSLIEFGNGYIDDGRIKDKEKLVEIIRLAIKKAGPKRINTSKVVCSLPESKAFLRIISIPLMNEEETSEAIKWEIEASIPLTCDQVYYDWQILKKLKDKQEILTVAVSRDVVDELMEVLELAGLNVFGLEVESIASVRSLVEYDSSRENISLIVDLGARGTSFIITEGNTPYFTSSIPFSSEGITDIISKIAGLSFEEAEKIKKLHGIEHSFENSSIFSAVKSALENLAGEIEKSIDFYQNVSKNSQEITK